VIEIVIFIFSPLRYSLPPFICIADAGKRSFSRGKFCDAIKSEEAVSTAGKYGYCLSIEKKMKNFILGNPMGGKT
jgi:hypothetical protein